jgi:hypothetical protein
MSPMDAKELRVALEIKIEVYLDELHAPVLEYGRKTGLLESIGEDPIFPTLDLAVRSIEAAV